MPAPPTNTAPTIEPHLRERMQGYVNLLDRWRRVTNLISASSFRQVWTRHILDCAQILAYAPDAKTWVDLGSGAGLPGLVIAAQLVERSGAVVHCIESDQRKCAFLREVVRDLALPAIIHAERIERANLSLIGHADAITARALAPLPILLKYAKPFFAPDTVAIFPRGQSDDEPLEPLDAAEYQVEQFPSTVDPRGRIVRIYRNL